MDRLITKNLHRHVLIDKARSVTDDTSAALVLNDSLLAKLILSLKLKPGENGWTRSSPHHSEKSQMFFELVRKKYLKVSWNPQTWFSGQNSYPMSDPPPEAVDVRAALEYPFKLMISELRNMGFKDVAQELQEAIREKLIWSEAHITTYTSKGSASALLDALARVATSKNLVGPYSGLREVSAGASLGWTCKHYFDEAGVLTGLTFIRTGTRNLPLYSVVLYRKGALTGDTRLDDRMRIEIKLLPDALVRGTPSLRATLKTLMYGGTRAVNSNAIEQMLYGIDGAAVLRACCADLHLGALLLNPSLTEIEEAASSYHGGTFWLSAWKGGVPVDNVPWVTYMQERCGLDLSRVTVDCVRACRAAVEVSLADDGDLDALASDCDDAAAATRRALRKRARLWVRDVSRPLLKSPVAKLLG